MNIKFKSVLVFKGIFTRIIFAVHGFVTVWRVVTVKENNAYWLLMIPLLSLFFELFVTFKLTKKGEWKWVCPSVLVFITSVIPSLCILEVDLVNRRIAYAEENNIEDCSVIDSSVYTVNQTSLTAQNLETSISINFSEENWNLILQQTLLFILIVGRWLLPKGNISRDQLSQLLLVYIGMAADILEFSTEGLKEDAVECSKIIVYLILILWAWSLVQFTLVLTATKARKPRLAGITSNNSQEEEEEQRRIKEQENDLEDNEPSSCMCCETEVWGICTGLVMQDGPFLVMRLYILIGLNAINQMMIFFTCKNALIFCLQVYRLAVLFYEKWNKKREAAEEDVENRPPDEPKKPKPSSISHVDIGEYFQQTPMKRQVSQDWKNYQKEGNPEKEKAESNRKNKIEEDDTNQSENKLES